MVEKSSIPAHIVVTNYDESKFEIIVYEGPAVVYKGIVSVGMLAYLNAKVSTLLLNHLQR